MSEQQLKMRILKICQQVRLNLSIQPLVHTYPIQGSLLAAVGKQLQETQSKIDTTQISTYEIESD